MVNCKRKLLAIFIINWTGFFFVPSFLCLMFLTQSEYVPVAILITICGKILIGCFTISTINRSIRAFATFALQRFHLFVVTRNDVLEHIASQVILER